MLSSNTKPCIRSSMGLYKLQSVVEEIRHTTAIPHQCHCGARSGILVPTPRRKRPGSSDYWRIIWHESFTNGKPKIVEKLELSELGEGMWKNRMTFWCPSSAKAQCCMGVICFGLRLCPETSQEQSYGMG